MKLLKFLLFMPIFFTAFSYAEELLIIQAISTSGKTFAVAKGYRDQVQVGQKSLFSTKKYSIMAQAVEVGQENSMWRISESDAIVPFKKGDFVNYSRYVEEVWSKLAELKDVYRRRREEKEKKVILNPYHFATRVGATHAFSENVNISGKTSNTSRQGAQVEVAIYRSLTPTIEMGFGFRHDRDSYVEDNPTVLISSKRYFLTVDFNYHFPKFETGLGNIYAAIGAGYGVSESTIDQQIISGKANILPYFKIGYLHPLVEGIKFVTELQVEAINTYEDFSSGETQKTSIINSRAAVGIRF